MRWLWDRTKDLRRRAFADAARLLPERGVEVQILDVLAALHGIAQDARFQMGALGGGQFAVE
jgi:hypothetical protein